MADGQHRRKMPAGGKTNRRQPRRLYAVFRGLALDQAHGALGILQRHFAAIGPALAW